MRGKHILVVDDIEVNRIILVKILNTLGAVCDTAVNGQDAVTANAFADDVRDALEAGMDAHIAKPVQVDTLKSTIRKVLDNRLEQSEEPEPAENA